MATFDARLHVIISVAILLPMSVTALVQPSEASTSTNDAAMGLLVQAQLVVNQVHNIVFCRKPTCRTAEDARVLSSDVEKLKVIQRKLAPLDVLFGRRSGFQSAVYKYVWDSASLVGPLEVAPSNATETQVWVGMVFVAIANLTSDFYVAQRERANTPIEFRPWVVGVVASIYEINLDTQTIGQGNLSASNAILVDEDIIQSSKSLALDANGPSVRFNKMVESLGHDVGLLYGQLIEHIEGKPTTLSISQMGSLNQKIFQEMQAVTSLERKLAGA